MQRATCNGEAEKGGDGRPVEIRIENASDPSGARQRAGQGRRSRSSSQRRPLPLRTAHHPPYASQPVGDAAPLGHDLVDEPRTVGFRQVAIGSNIEGHRSQRWRATDDRLVSPFFHDRRAQAEAAAEVERLNHEINFVLPKEIERARAHGDLRENSEYKRRSSGSNS